MPLVRFDLHRCQVCRSRLPPLTGGLRARCKRTCGAAPSFLEIWYQLVLLGSLLLTVTARLVKNPNSTGRDPPARASSPGRPQERERARAEERRERRHVRSRHPRRTAPLVIVATGTPVAPLLPYPRRPRGRFRAPLPGPRTGVRGQSRPASPPPTRGRSARC